MRELGINTKDIGRLFYDKAVAAHNAAVLGILPSMYKMKGHEGLIEADEIFMKE